jgi:hypothetical protein
VHFTLWTSTPTTDGDRYDVLHLSTPALEVIETGRHW